LAEDHLPPATTPGRDGPHSLSTGTILYPAVQGSNYNISDMHKRIDSSGQELRRFRPDRGRRHRGGGGGRPRRSGTQDSLKMPHERELSRAGRGPREQLARADHRSFTHLDRLWRYDPNYLGNSRIVTDPENDARCRRPQKDTHAALMFAAHLANWELLPHAAPAGGRKIALVYRAPNVGRIAEVLARIRADCVAAINPAGRDTPLRIKEAMPRGWKVGMLVDQHYATGIDVTFFNRRCKVNPLLARFAQLFECPVQGSRVIRLPDGRFRFEETDALDLPRDADGKVDVAATMRMVTSMIGSWVREYPEQWMWIHQRWRQ
jgi:predicted LPLAT superfamily acyltransferase